jgi:hypothetical protein
MSTQPLARSERPQRSESVVWDIERGSCAGEGTPEYRNIEAPDARVPGSHTPTKCGTVILDTTTRWNFGALDDALLKHDNAAAQDEADSQAVRSSVSLCPSQSASQAGQRALPVTVEAPSLVRLTRSKYFNGGPAKLRQHVANSELDPPGNFLLTVDDGQLVSTPWRRDTEARVGSLVRSNNSAHSQEVGQRIDDSGRTMYSWSSGNFVSARMLPRLPYHDSWDDELSDGAYVSLLADYSAQLKPSQDFVADERDALKQQSVYTAYDYASEFEGDAVLDVSLDSYAPVVSEEMELGLSVYNGYGCDTVDEDDIYLNDTDDVLRIHPASVEEDIDIAEDYAWNYNPERADGITYETPGDVLVEVGDILLDSELEAISTVVSETSVTAAGHFRLDCAPQFSEGPTLLLRSGRVSINLESDGVRGCGMAQEAAKYPTVSKVEEDVAKGLRGHWLPQRL